MRLVPKLERERARLRSADDIIARVLDASATRSLENTLSPFDDAVGEIDFVGSQAGLFANVHPEAPFRTAAERIGQEAQAAAARLNLNRQLYDALAALDTEGSDAATRHYVDKTLRDFRLSGVTRDEASRRRVQELREELVLIGQEFLRNIRSDRRTVTLHDVSELAGLPADYVAQHPPAPDGTITLTIDTPDSLPVLLYAESDDLRRRMFMEYNNRAFPANEDVLVRMLARRHELAQLLGFSTWADFITADKMVKSARNVAAFIDRVAEASRAAADREFTRLLNGKRSAIPDATRIEAWESSFWTERLRRAEYASDSQAVRPYFAYDQVKQGIFRIASLLFGVEFARVNGAPVWHDSVELWEMTADSSAASISTCIRGTTSTITLPPFRSRPEHEASGSRWRRSSATSPAGEVRGTRDSSSTRTSSRSSTSSATSSTSCSEGINAGSASVASQPSTTSSRRRRRCSKSGPGTPPRSPPSRVITRRENPFQRRSSSGCARPTSSERRSASGARCCSPSSRSLCTPKTPPGST